MNLFQQLVTADTVYQNYSRIRYLRNSLGRIMWLKKKRMVPVLVSIWLKLLLNLQKEKYGLKVKKEKERNSFSVCHYTIPSLISRLKISRKHILNGHICRRF